MMKILLCDPEHARHKAIQKLMSGHNLDSTFNGWEGLGGVLMYRPDVLVLNLQVPVMCGIEVMRLLNTEPAGGALRVVAYCEPMDLRLVRAAEDFGFAFVHESPFDPQTVTQSILAAAPAKAAPAA